MLNHISRTPSDVPLKHLGTISHMKLHQLSPAAWRKRRTEVAFRRALDELIEEVTTRPHGVPVTNSALNLAHLVDDVSLVEILIGALAAHATTSRTAREVGRRLTCVHCPTITGSLPLFLESAALARATRSQFAVFRYLFAEQPSLRGLSFSSYLRFRAGTCAELDPVARELAATLSEEWRGTLSELLETAGAVCAPRE